MKSYNFILVLKSFHSSSSFLSLSLVRDFSASLAITRGIRQLLRNQHERRTQCLVSRSVQWCEWHWAIWIVCRIVSTDWVFWKSLCSCGCKHPLQSVSLLNQLKDACLSAHWNTALHTRNTADLTELLLLQNCSARSCTLLWLWQTTKKSWRHISQRERNEICFAVKKPDIYTAVKSGEQHL